MCKNFYGTTYQNQGLVVAMSSMKLSETTGGRNTWNRWSLKVSIKTLRGEEHVEVHGPAAYSMHRIAGKTAISYRYSVNQQGQQTLIDFNCIENVTTAII